MAGKWTKELVIEAIRKMAEDNEDLAYRRVEAKFGKSVIRAAETYWGGWKAAVEAAGINYKEIKKVDHIQWTKAKVIKNIQWLAGNDFQLNAENVRTRNPRLFDAGVRYFGSWTQACQASGLDYSAIHKEMLERLRVERRQTKALLKSEILQNFVTSKGGNWTSGERLELLNEIALAGCEQVKTETIDLLLGKFVNNTQANTRISAELVSKIDSYDSDTTKTDMVSLFDDLGKPSNSSGHQTGAKSPMEHQTASSPTGLSSAQGAVQTEQRTEMANNPEDKTGRPTDQPPRA